MLVLQKLQVRVFRCGSDDVLNFKPHLKAKMKFKFHVNFFCTGSDLCQISVKELEMADSVNVAV